MFGPHVDRAHAKGRGRPSIVAHIKAARAAAEDVDFDVRAFQMFIAGPRNMNITLRDEEVDELSDYIRSTGIVGVAHGTYMDSPWAGSKYAATFIKKELAICARAGLSGLVIHLGKPNVETVVKYLPDLVVDPDDAETAGDPDDAESADNPDDAEDDDIAKATPLIYLEVPHVKPENSHYETPGKLADLFRAIRKEVDPELQSFGLCIDTAHLWSCGADIQSYKSAEEWIAGLESVADVIPPDRIMIHLNDSLDGLGSGIDRHATLMQGEIWKSYEDRPQESGLAAFVEYAVRNNTVVILERKPISALLDDYATLHKLTAAVRA